MSRKDFVLVAEIIASISDPWAKGEAITKACERFQQVNPRFDSNRFRAHVEKLSTT